MSKPSIIHVQRHPTHFFSVERMYTSIRNHLSSLFIVKTFILPYPSMGILRPLLNALSCLSLRSDVIHVLGDTTYSAILLPSKHVVLTILDCISLTRSSGLKKLILLIFWYWLPIRRASIITVISHSVKSDLIKFVGCDPSKIIVIPVPLTFSIRPSPFVFNQSFPSVLLVGTTENKNIHNCLLALSRFKCHIVILGQLSISQAHLLSTLNISYQNFYDLSDDEVLRCYIQSDLLLFASTYEGFGMPIIEANAVGRPVITSNTSSMPEVAGNSAILVDPFSVNSIISGLSRVIGSSATRSLLISNGFSNVRRFSPQVISDQYISLYHSLIRSTL